MKLNMSLADRVIRFAIAAVIAVLYMTEVLSGTLAIVLLALALILVLTSVVGFCPLYALLGIDTNKHKTTEAE